MSGSSGEHDPPDPMREVTLSYDTARYVSWLIPSSVILLSGHCPRTDSISLCFAEEGQKNGIIVAQSQVCSDPNLDIVQ
jgi:hypothetical protein